jgi:hypothetical protein
MKDCSCANHFICFSKGKYLENLQLPLFAQLPVLAVNGSSWYFTCNHSYFVSVSALSVPPLALKQR